MELPGRILVFPVSADGLPSAAPVTNISNGLVPFSFDFSQQGHLLVTEVLGNLPAAPAAGAVTSYNIDQDGNLQMVSSSVANFQEATCWLAAGRRYVYTSNTDSDTLSGYRVDADGSLHLLNEDGIAAVTGDRPIDLALSQNGRFLYVLEPGTGIIRGWEVNPEDGSLTEIGTIGGFPILSGTAGIAVR